MADGGKVAWICTACGYIHDGEQPPDRCPACAVSGDCFEPYVELQAGSRAEDDIVLDDAILGDEEEA